MSRNLTKIIRLNTQIQVTVFIYVIYLKSSLQDKIHKLMILLELPQGH